MSYANEALYVELDINSTCEIELGDETKSYANQFATVTIDDRSFVIINRGTEIDGEMLNLYNGEISLDYIKKWQLIFGINAVITKGELPTVEEVI